MNEDKERQEFQQFLADWEARMRSIPGCPESKKGGGLIVKLWSLLKALLESLGSLF